MRNSRDIVCSSFRWTVTLAVALGVLSCGSEREGQLTEGRAREITSQYREARNTANLDLLDEIYAPDVVVHDNGAPEDIRGLDALKSFYETSHAGFPDFRIEYDNVLVADGHIVIRWTVEATHADTLRGIPPTGREVSFSGVAIDRVEEGRIVEEWVYFNPLDLMQQLGLSPPLADPSPGI